MCITRFHKKQCGHGRDSRANFKERDNMAIRRTIGLTAVMAGVLVACGGGDGGGSSLSLGAANVSPTFLKGEYLQQDL